MQGPYHDFLLLSLDDYDFADYMALIGNPRAIRIAYDVILYLNDTLRWIPTINPAMKNEAIQGLCLYGPTVIHTDGAPVAKSLFGGWAEVFSQGPETLTLKGGWTYLEGQPPETGHYKSLQVERDPLVSDLRRLESYASKVSKSGGRHFILHLGI